MSGEINIFGPQCEGKTVIAMEEAMRTDITPEITQRVSSVDPQIIKQKEKEFSEDLTTYIKNDPECDTVKSMRTYFGNWNCNLPDGNYGEDICRYRQANIILKYIDKPNSENIKGGLIKPSDLFLSQTPREFHATVFACLIAEKEKIKIGELLEMNDENKFNKNEQYVKLDNYTIPAFLRLLALGYSRTDLTQ